MRLFCPFSRFLLRLVCEIGHLKKAASWWYVDPIDCGEMIFVIFTRSQDTLAGLRARHLAVCATWRSTMATSFHLLSLALRQGRTRVAAKESTSVQF
jgi:hypothetical protein